MKEFSPDKNDRILILSPHPDDESIGCGSILIKYGMQSDVLLATYGDYGNPEWTNNRTRRVRKAEFTSAMNQARVNKVFYLGLKDCELNKNDKSLYNFDFSLYKYIFVPNRYDNHPDHQALYWMMKKAFQHQKIKENVIVLEYEVWTPLMEFDYYTNYEKNEKADLIRNYKSQLKHIEYVRMSEGLGTYRTGCLGVRTELKTEVYRHDKKESILCWMHGLCKCLSNQKYM